ncbi:MAG: hypothetical protein AB8U25_05590 [Rickettsiales endosymbiont of Dermacentor nuttalli]
MYVDQINVGDILRVKPGEKIPVDDIVIAGNSLVDESTLERTYASIKKLPEHKVIGTMINSTSGFIMSICKVGNNHAFSNYSLWFPKHSVHAYLFKHLLILSLVTLFT